MCNIIRAIAYILFSILTLWMGWSGVFFYGDRGDAAMWFARSGAIVTIFAAMAEVLMAQYWVGSINQGITSTSISDFAKRHREVILFLQGLSGFLIVIGTMVWAYGDLIYTTWK